MPRPKEVVGGFLLIEAETFDAAVGLFNDDPISTHARLEIRPLKQTDMHSETGQRRPQFRHE